MEIDGYVFGHGLDALSSLIEASSVPPVVSLIKQAIFRPRCGVLPQERGNTPRLLRSTSLAELVDNYHDHQASRLHDKVYALMGMCNDNLHDTGLELNYALPWKTLLLRLTQHLLGDVSVRTWDDRQVALIVSRGSVLGQISQIEERAGPNFGQTIEATFQNTFDVERPDYWQRTARWTLASSAKRVQVGDIICQLQHAPLPTIIRFCEDHFNVIICAMAPPEFFTSTEAESDASESSTSEEAEPDASEFSTSEEAAFDEGDRWKSLPVSTFQSCEFLLLWAWEPIIDPHWLLQEMQSELEGTDTLNVDGTKNSEQRHMSVAARHWQTALVLENCGQHELAREKFRLAIRTFQTVTGEQYKDLAQDQLRLTPLCWAAERGDAALVEKMLAYDPDGINVTDGGRGSTPLLWAAKNGHVPVMQKLLDFDKMDINAKSIQADTALSWAARSGHADAVALLLTKLGIDVDAKNSTGKTALVFAAENGHHQVVKLLLYEGFADPNARSGDTKETPLILAARSGHVVVVEILLDFVQCKHESETVPSRRSSSPLLTEESAHSSHPEHASDRQVVDVSARCVDGFTALIRATRYGHLEVVKLLLKVSDKEVECKDTKYGQTALAWAAEWGHDPVVDLLLQTGADPKTTSHDGKTPLIWAAKKGNVGVVKQLLEACSQEIETKDTKYGKTALAWAAQYGQIGVVEELLRAGAQANTTGFTGRTPLSYAAAKGRDEVVDRLLSTEGVDFDLADHKYGQTPLIWAIENGHTAVAKKFIALKGLKVNARCMRGQTALSWAAREQNTAVMKSILAREEVEIDTKNTHGQTPLSLAAEAGHEEAVRSLLMTGKADVHRSSYDGTSILTFAAKAGHSTIVKLLLDAGSDIHQKDDQYGENALMWAAERGHEETVKVLLAARTANPNLQCLSGKTALIRAAENGHGLTLRALLDGGSDINLADKYYGQAALSWAAEAGHADCVRVLLEASDIDVGAKSNYGKTAMEYASDEGHDDIVELLKAHDALQRQAPLTNLNDGTIA